MSMPLETLLLDLDGTLIVDQGSGGRDARAVRLLEGVTRGLRRFRDAGCRFFVVTNQGGIGLGEYPLEAFLACAKKMRELLNREGIHIEALEYCPHAPSEGCSCRKPAIGMWEALKLKFTDLEAKNSLMVGDKDRDVEFGKAIGCRTARIRSAVYPHTVDADITVNDLAELSDALLPSGKVMSLAEAAAFSAAARAQGKTVVTTNGAFDLLHDGHKFLFSQARKHGDVLIVGVNSDATVQKQKGNDRPADPQDVRASNVAKFADAVFIFSDPDPRPWLAHIRPHVHVNAETYGKDCVEAAVLREIGAKLVLVPVQSERGSTTELLRKRSA
jgi:rfaE bifunctional protein nucleotidyltransferase chain/domain